ncbi:MAG: 4-(cytidine 5'-diphospho)-2-C-methyl-D-erythritol kinase [Caulobacteraceae bacterium]|nr:4-(cytidine 5'-diphospho)-2-C-methyl-D-erythritol kinase [Caulobacteraceae bacterium]
MSRAAEDPGFAPAKVNLFLHVGPLGADGYHPVSTLMAFADIGDRLSAGAHEGGLKLSVIGPFAHDLTQGDNLVLRAARLLDERGSAALMLDKQLPGAAGLGGGSSDAAAALRLLNAGWGLDFNPGVLETLAAQLGADVPACLVARALIGEGRGERLRPAPALPELNAVLVNPLVPVSTAEVFAAYDRASPPDADAEPPYLPDLFESVEEAAAVLAYCRNDLEAPAIAVQPAIGDLLADLRAEPETLLARMSGSGATCYALCADDIAAETLAERLEALRPDWWVRRTTLS